MPSEAERKMKLWWNAPRWLCGLLTKHRMDHRFANYNTDAAGIRCACGYHYADDRCITENQRERGYIIAGERERYAKLRELPVRDDDPHICPTCGNTCKITHTNPLCIAVREKELEGK